MRTIGHLRFIIWLGVLSLVRFCAEGANPPEIVTRYSPLHPPNHQPVQFDIRASHSSGIRRIRLYVFEYEWESNQTTVRRRNPGLWGKVQDWSVSGPTVSKQYQVPGFAAGTFVVYAVQVNPATGPQAVERWGFAAGDWPLGNEPVPLWISPPLTAAGDPESIVASDQAGKTNRIHVVFIPQQNDAYAQPRDMLTDVDDQIFNRLLSHPTITQAKQLWAFDYSPEFGSISPYSSGGSTRTLTGAQTTSTNTGANVGIILHQAEFQDWSSGHFVGTQPGAGNFGTTIHELGHSVFALADEYDVDGAYGVGPEPFQNVFDNQVDAFQYVLTNGWDSHNVEKIASGNFWRVEPAALNCVMQTTGNPPPRFAQSCQRRVQFVYEQFP
jgi:hypothetical protein